MDVFVDLINGSDSNDGSSREMEKQTLQAALAVAGAGGRIVVKSGHGDHQPEAGK